MAWGFLEKPKETTPPKEPHVFVGIPHTGNMSSEFVERTYIPLKTAPSGVFNRRFMLCKTASLPAARNMLVVEAIKANATHLFFLDTDVILLEPVKAIELLLQCKEPIVSGLYRRRSSLGYEWCAFLKAGPDIKGYVPIQQWTGNWITCDVVGMGCCLIQMEVFKKVLPPWFVWHDPEGSSEDFAFCEKAREAGYKIFVYTEVQSAHLGTFKLMPDGSFKMPEV